MIPRSSSTSGRRSSTRPGRGRCWREPRGSPRSRSPGCSASSSSAICTTATCGDCSAFFARVAAAAGVAASEIAHVGDRLDNDVLPARAAGMVSVFIRRGPWGHVHALCPEVAQADLRIESRQELPGLLGAAASA